MVTVILALSSAVMYGLSDFLGGVLGRRTSIWSLAIVTQVAAFALIGGAGLLLGGRPEPVDWAWGALAGIGTGVGTAFLYRGLARHRMGVVAPLSAVGAAMLPVVVGLVAGERPPLASWIGIGVAIPAIWLISGAANSGVTRTDGRALPPGVFDGLVAGLGFGLMFSALGQVPETAGLGPLSAAEASSIVAVAAVALLMREPWLPRDRASLGGLPVGALAAAASVLFLFATQTGLLAVASVLTSLYPAFTVLLAALVLREPIHRGQAVGLGLAVAAVGLVATG